MTFDELATMDGIHCIVQIRGVRPFSQKNMIWISIQITS